MLFTVMRMVAAPAETPTNDNARISCQTIKDHALKSRRIVACGTDAQWRAYQSSRRKAERGAITDSQAQGYAGVNSGS